MTAHTITASNIEDETYFNLVKLIEITGYAYPDKAIKSMGCEWTVVKDDCGNISPKATWDHFASLLPASKA